MNDDQFRVGKAICVALGLSDKLVTSIDITVRPDDYPRVDVGFFLEPAGAEVFREFKLVPVYDAIEAAKEELDVRFDALVQKTRLAFAELAWKQSRVRFDDRCDALRYALAGRVGNAAYRV
jgi:hypothetical protein